MPRFYFDLFLGSHSNIDEEGHELVRLRTAEFEAIRTAGEFARDRLFTLRDAIPKEIRIEVRNEHRWPVLTATVSTRVDRADKRHSLE
jgi:uncharacterized protein DUF6894